MVWGFLGKQVLQRCTETIGKLYWFSDSNAERRSLSNCRRRCPPKPSLNVKFCRWIVARKFWWFAEPLPAKLLKRHLPRSTGTSSYSAAPLWQFLFISIDFDNDFFSLALVSRLLRLLVQRYRASVLLTERKHLRYLTRKGKLQSTVFLRKHELI